MAQYFKYKFFQKIIVDLANEFSMLNFVRIGVIWWQGRIRYYSEIIWFNKKNIGLNTQIHAIGGCKGGARDASRFNFFHFHAVLGNLAKY